MYSARYLSVVCQGLQTMVLLKTRLLILLEACFNSLVIQLGPMVLILEIQASLKQTHSLVLLCQE